MVWGHPWPQSLCGLCLWRSEAAPWGATALQTPHLIPGGSCGEFGSQPGDLGRGSPPGMWRGGLGGGSPPESEGATPSGPSDSQARETYKSGSRFVGRFSVLRGTRGAPEAPGDRSGSTNSASCIRSQPRRPILRPIRGYFVCLGSAEKQKDTKVHLRFPKVSPEG